MEQAILTVSSPKCRLNRTIPQDSREIFAHNEANEKVNNFYEWVEIAIFLFHFFQMNIKFFYADTLA